MVENKIDICGVKIDNVSFSEAIGQIDYLIKERKSLFVVTPNIDHIVRIHQDNEFKSIYDEASLVLADGVPILWASRFLGKPLKEKVSGSDLFPQLCKDSADKGYRLFFLGGREGAALKSAEVLKSRYPKIQVVGVYSPPFGFETNEMENNKIVQMLLESKPDILFVGLGSPKQEKWICKYKDQYCVPVSIGIGVSFEFVAGMVKRAPVWMQKCGLEWFWRLMMEPQRLWKRYLIDDVQFFGLILKQKFEYKTHNTINEKLKRISYLDGLRGIAILMVVLYHSYARWPQIVPFGDQYSAIVFFKYGGLGVFLFFMISGFVILMTLEKTTNFFQFMYHRWLRLFPAMLIVSILIFVTARTLFPERPLGIPVLRDILPGITLIGENPLGWIFHSHQGILEGSFWSLFVEIRFYIIFGIIFFTFGVNLAIASLICFFACLILNIHFLGRLPESMGWFASGAMYYLYFKSGKKKWLSMGILMGLVSAASLLGDLEYKLAGTIVSLLFLGAVMSERIQEILSSRFLLFWGFISYPLYLIHENMVVSLIVKFGRWMPFLPGFLLPIFPILIVAAIAWLVATYAEPGLRGILRRIFEGRKMVKLADSKEKTV